MKNTYTIPFSHFTYTKKTVICGLMIALGILLPMHTHLTGLPGGPVLLPMHLPVFLAGMLCGAPYGALVGLVLPAISTALTGMPKLFPTMPLMTIELAVYGSIVGLLFSKFPQYKLMSLLGAMIAGRIANAVALIVASKMLMLSVPQPAIVLTSIITGLPGVAIQLIVIPIIIKFVEQYYGYNKKASN